MLRSLFLGTGLILLSPFVRAGLPVLTESGGETAVMYVDDKDPAILHYIPNYAVFQKGERGVPHFGMSYWGLSRGYQGEDTKAGGRFSAILEMIPNENLKQAINTAKTEGKRPRVVPVQSSGLDFLNPDGTPYDTEIFKKVKVARAGGQASDPVGINASLTALGAAHFLEVLRSGGNGETLFYCYNVKGVTPQFHGKITINYSMIYDHLLARANFKKFFFFRLDLEREVETLRGGTEIQIEILSANTATDKDWSKHIVDFLLEKFFTKDVNPAKETSRERFALKSRHQEQNQTFSYEINEKVIVEREFCNPLAIADLSQYPQLFRRLDGRQQ